MVKRSHGAYTHDDVWQLNLIFVMELLLMYYEQDAYLSRRHRVKEELKQK